MYEFRCEQEETIMELKGSKTEANLQAAFAGESQARNKYTYYAAKAKKEDRKAEGTAGEEFDLYTETLARIYADQGYYEQAKHIYSKLILAYPEKNAYFAALIENLERINN